MLQGRSDLLSLVLITRTLLEGDKLESYVLMFVYEFVYFSGYLIELVHHASEKRCRSLSSHKYMSF